MRHSVPKGIRLMIYRLLLTPGYTVRMVMRESETGRDQVLRMRRALYRANFQLPNCPCGKEAGHKGWCLWRTARSEARLKHLKAMHKYSEFSLKEKDLDKAALRHSERNRAYYKQNAERIKEQKRAYYVANRETIRERVKNYRLETRQA